MNTFFRNTKIIERMQEGPLGRFVGDYAAQLRSEGYARLTGQFEIRLVAHFSRWLAHRGIAADRISDQQAASFLRSRARAGYRISSMDRPALDRLLGLLRGRAVIAEKKLTVLAPGPTEVVLQAYVRYLEKERGLVLKTRNNYLPCIRRFLMSKFGAFSVDLSAFRATDVINFVQQSAGQMIPKQAQMITSALRSFLRFAQYSGKVTSNLAACVPSVANWSLSTVPKSLPPGDVKRVLAGSNRETAIGRRDYAILLLLARLGLRAGEVANLALDDIDWEKGCITIRGKAGRVDQLPLPTDVGRAIAAYLREGRPISSNSRRLFLRIKAPITSFKDHRTVGSIVKSALARAGINSPRKGAHQFRHALATDMLREGRSLSEIGEILRHRSPQTTAIYAKVDLRSLRSLALPWIGGGQ